MARRTDVHDNEWMAFRAHYEHLRTVHDVSSRDLAGIRDPEALLDLHRHLAPECPWG